MKHALVDPRPDLLPTDKLTPGDFEKLLLAVAREVDGLRELHLYGVPGQRQHGLDVIGFDATRSAHGYQGKRYATFTAHDLAAAVEDYTSGQRPIRVVRLVIGVATEARRTEIINELAAQQARHPDLRIELYDQRRLSELLRDRPDIVRTFFGDGIAERFCLASEAVPTRADIGVLDAAALADAVMRGPVEATGVAGVLAEAERRRDDQPDEAAAAYARVEQALEDNGFAAHALLIRRRRPAVLRAARRLDEAAELLADLAWIYLDRGDVDEARMVLHELNETVGREPAASDAPSVVSVQTQLLQQAVDASVTLLQDPIDRLDSLGTVIDQLGAEQHPYAGRATVLFAETALAAEQTGEILGRAPALHALAADLAERSHEDKELAIRLRLCLADAESQCQGPAGCGSPPNTAQRAGGIVVCQVCA